MDTVFNQVTQYNGDYQKLGGSRNVDILVFPELSIASEWIYGICKQAKKERIAVIGGLQHIVIGSKVFNIVVTMVPIQNEHCTEIVPIFRPKNYFAPGEKFFIEELRNSNGEQLKVVEPKKQQYHLITANGMQFTIYNCYELTDIRHRSLMRGDLDLLFACEWNRDINYFSNIVESSARDLHCYVVQVNNAKYGDSRILIPGKSEMKNILQIKGGINPAILVAEIDVALLRDFQQTGFGLQKDSRMFKPTPAGYEMKKVKERVGRR